MPSGLLPARVAPAAVAPESSSDEDADGTDSEASDAGSYVAAAPVGSPVADIADVEVGGHHIHHIEYDEADVVEFTVKKAHSLVCGRCRDQLLHGRTLSIAS